MYLKEIAVRNSGPIEAFDLKLDFTSSGDPIPYVFVGANGSGKTNLLSLVADSLFEGAASGYQDVAPTQGLGRSWFRVVGGKTIRIGAAGGFSILRFAEGQSTFFYKERGGTYPQTTAIGQISGEMHPGAQWPDDGNIKEFSLPEAESRRIFASGAYAYFPSSRSEYPYWLNRVSLGDDVFDTSAGFANELRKPIFVEKGLDKFSQWVMSVILDARVDAGPVQKIINDAANPNNGSFDISSFGKALASAYQGIGAYFSANKILQIILNDANVRFAWAGREHSQKICLVRGDSIIANGLDALSGGQSSLLSIFGTILRYGDHGTSNNFQPENISGICIIDEIDAHMHVELQLNAIPILIKSFPKIQFIISGHSPLFVLGLENHLTKDGVRLVEVPTGKILSAESFSEFGHAFDSFKATSAFIDAISQAANGSLQAQIWLEGETDPIYFMEAARRLGFNDLLAKATFEWIGAKDNKSGQGFNTGKDALDKAASFFRANPKLVKNKFVLLYDCDTKKPEWDQGDLHARTIPFNSGNSIAKSGVENLLPESAFSDDVYVVTERQREYGGSVTTKELDKMKLCLKVCASQDGNWFDNFVGILKVLDDLVR